ncbi:IQ domain-containing protein H-like isoform X2 [Mytilus galloprovincialis]|uniref:IQ domain-containing protein H-like isoform X2 n=1 Tax=Mytilus galloprovincialis TaxID=29158 RepID=UPI003F7C5DCF
MSDVSAEILNFLKRHETLTPETKLTVKKSIQPGKGRSPSNEKRKTFLSGSLKDLPLSVKESDETDCKDSNTESFAKKRPSLFSNELIASLSKEPLVYTHRVQPFKPIFYEETLDDNKNYSRQKEMHEILKNVQDDLRQLREKIAQGDTANINIQDLEKALAKTEEGLQNKTEQIINQYNNQVQTLPYATASRFDQNVSLETTLDLRTQSKVDDVRRISGPVFPRERNIHQPQPPSGSGALLPKRQAVQVSGPTPGQQARHVLTLRTVLNPQNKYNRDSLNDNFGIVLPLIQQRNKSKQLGKTVLGSTIEPLAVLPRANRVDTQLAPPAITEDDARRGILSLIERGLIPPAAQLTLDPSPVKNRLATLHDPVDRTKPPQQAEPVTTLAGVRLDVSTKGSSQSDNITRMPVVPPHPKSAGSTETRTPSAKSRATTTTIPMVKTPATMKTYEMVYTQPMPGTTPQLPPPTTPASGDQKQIMHRFAIQNGKIRDTSADFMAFKQHYCLSWGSIVTMMGHLLRLLNKYMIPIAFINGDRLADLALEFELEKAPSIREILSVVINRDDVENIINKPGRQYRSSSGQDIAATRIQSAWRMFRDRSEYLEYRRKKWAAGVIAISWIMHIKMSKVREQLHQTRDDNLEAFRRRAKKFAMSWDRIKNSRRVIIHIPSLGLSQDIRDNINDFAIRQNTQMARLCDIRDPNVDVIYVSPVPIHDETEQYYSKLLGLKHAVDSGEVEDQANMGERYHVIMPEAINSFQGHRFCLSSLLKYSPRALRRIKTLIKGREAYIVTGVPHKDDLAIADFLDVPILAPEPEVAHLYSTKSGCKRIFASANVEMPPSEYDVYSLGQLHESLAQLVTENLTVRRWLFKLDDEFDGRGIAYCDIADHLQCYPWALKESRRYGDKWDRKWAQEAAYIKIHAEIPEVLATHAKPVNTKLYPTWDSFLDAFLSQGGVIEACPPSDTTTTISVDMLIEPTGKFNIVCLGDQIHADTPFSCWGVSIPQSSIEPDDLNVACKRVAEACKSRGILGHFCVDFITFIDPKTETQKLWALDLSLHFSDSLSMYQLMQYVSNGALDTTTHEFNVPAPKSDSTKRRRRRLAGEKEEAPPNTSRYGVMSTKLLHTNLAVVHYSVFFQMCRAHGIGYDIKEKQGTVFTLIDNTKRERLGMLTIGDDLKSSLANFARNLSTIHQEISAPNMQGETNFKYGYYLEDPDAIAHSEAIKSAIKDVEAILNITIENAEEYEEIQKTS